MTTETIERKTLFLYPELDKLTDYQDINNVIHLVSDISKIATISNEVINKILSNGCFSKIRCKPSVTLRCIANCFNFENEYQNVRICITNYCGTDYSKFYGSVIDDYKHNRSDISHLVAISIKLSGRTIFRADPENNFDVIIEVDLSNLDVVLESIMLDIALYHYFALSNDLNSRKHFNSQKFEYIKKTITEPDKSGFDFTSSDCFYLPFSLDAIKKYNIRSNSTSLMGTVDNLIVEYGYFIATTLSVQLLYNEHGAIRSETDKLADYGFLSSFMSSDTTARGFVQANSKFIVIACHVDSTHYKAHSALCLDKANLNPSAWLQLVDEHEEVKLFLLKPEKEVK